MVEMQARGHGRELHDFAAFLARADGGRSAVSNVGHAGQVVARTTCTS